jgi:transposase InsO family protein
MKQMKVSTIRQTFNQINNISKTARILKIDRKTVRKWTKKRYSRSFSGYICKRRKSTRPKRIHSRISIETKYLVVKLRESTGYDQVKLAYILKNKYQICISPKSVYNILNKRARYLIDSRPKYKRPRFQDSIHMRPSNTKEIGYLQMDIKYVTPELSGLHHTYYEYALIDIHSRYKYALILPSLDTEATITALRGSIKEFPFKIVFVQTDNGWEFGRRFHEECINLGIRHYYIHKSTPNENAVIERSFRTDQEEFYYVLHKRPKDLNELNILFREYLSNYNTIRPHISLCLKTPLEVVQCCI